MAVPEYGLSSNLDRHPAPSERESVGDTHSGRRRSRHWQRVLVAYPNIDFAVLILGSTFLMGSSFVAGKLLLARGVPPLLLVGWRFLIAALFALPFAYLHGGRSWRSLMPLHARDATWTAIIGLVQTAAVMGFLFLAMRTISASTAAILLFTNPLWVAMLGPFFLNERLKLSSYLGMAVGVVGVALAIGLKGGAFSLAEVVGDGIALVSAFCWATATIVKQRTDVKLGTWAMTFWQMLVGSLAVLALAYGEGDRWPPELSRVDWTWFLWLALPASTGSFGLWFAALERGGATKSSGFLFLTPLFTIALSFVVLGHPITLTQVCGGLLVGVALWLLNRSSGKESKR